jgi:hypothetical protein
VRSSKFGVESSEFGVESPKCGVISPKLAGAIGYTIEVYSKIKYFEKLIIKLVIAFCPRMGHTFIISMP